MHLVNYKAIEKQWLLSKGEFKRVLGHPLKLLFLLLLFFVLISVGQYVIGRGDTLPSIVIVDEDGSVEVRTFIENVAYNKLKDVARFEEVSFQEGIEKLEAGQSIGMIHIPAGTRANLDTLEPSTMYLYVQNQEDIRAEFLMGYIDDMVDLLNKGQSGAMVYWQEMSRQGVSYDDRIQALNDISFDYGIAFLTRGDVFATENIEDPLQGYLPIQFFGYGLLWLALIISSLFIQSSIITDRRLGIERRLILSGYSIKDYIVSRIMTGSIFALGWIVVLLAMFKLVLGIGLIKGNLVLWFLLLWIDCLINGFIVWTFMNNHRRGAVIGVGVVSVLMLLSSGLIIPEFYMNNLLSKLGQINLINYGDNMLKGYRLMTWRSLLPLFYSGLLFVGISMTSKEARL